MDSLASLSRAALLGFVHIHTLKYSDPARELRARSFLWASFPMAPRAVAKAAYAARRRCAEDVRLGSRRAGAQVL